MVRRSRPRLERGRGWRLAILVGLAGVTGLVDEVQGRTNAPVFPDRAIAYCHDIVEEAPWSIHIVRMSRRQSGLSLETSLGGGVVLGMGTVTEQVQRFPGDAGLPLAAINGDFYFSTDRYPGRPRDLQVFQGEVVSAPAGHSCLWLDDAGGAHMTNVQSRFRVRWPGGREVPMGLNSRRDDLSIVLFTSVAGASTRTMGGMELELVDDSPSGWQPLRVGETRVATVRSVFPQGDTPLDRSKAVLSVGSDWIERLPKVEAGTSKVTLILETVPALSGVSMAIGGGPALVRDGKPGTWDELVPFRHPRSAVGWNDQYFYLVQVDGRQGGVSVGMTLRELAEYLVQLGCRDALNLDGGGSSTLWAFGNTQNNPSEGRERPGANGVVIVKRRADE